jgi:hypothetical protein
MRKCLLLIFSFLKFSFVFCQDQTQLVRTPYKLQVVVTKDVTYEEDIQATPYVLPKNTIQLYPGEKIYVEVEQENNEIKSMTAVKEIKDSSKTLIISFTQTLKKKVHESMMLNIHNPFSTALAYDAQIYLLAQKKWGNTDVYPVEARLSGIEIWPDVITSIGLGHWKFQAK